MILKIDEFSSVPKYRQIVDAIRKGIEVGQLTRNQQLPSINELSEDYYLARDTVEKAYNLLKKEGVIEAVRGKGFFVRTSSPAQMRVLLIMNKLSAYKKIIYYSLLNTLGGEATVDLRLHHHDARRLNDLLTENLGSYHYYVIMPHFYEGLQEVSVRELLGQIPADKLVLLDKDYPHLPGQYKAVFQQFDRDIYHALESGLDLIGRYKRLTLVFPCEGQYPREIIHGFRSFCVHHHLPYSLMETLTGHPIERDTAYIVLEDSDLAELVRQARQQNWQLGREVGVVAFNETPLKEVLADGITVISTDHEQMGVTAARLMLENRSEKIQNPFQLIRRASL